MQTKREGKEGDEERRTGGGGGRKYTDVQGGSENQTWTSDGDAPPKVKHS